MSIKLYDVPDVFRALEAELLETEGELTPDLEKRFDDFLQSGKDKLEAGAMVMRGLELEAEACKEEAKRLYARSVSLDNNASRLKKLILFALDGGFGGKVKTALFTLWGQTSAPTKSIDLAPMTDLAELPQQFVRVKRELAKDAIKEALAKGEILPEEIIVTEMPGTRFLRVK